MRGAYLLCLLPEPRAVRRELHAPVHSMRRAWVVGERARSHSALHIVHEEVFVICLQLVHKSKMPGLELRVNISEEVGSSLEDAVAVQNTFRAESLLLESHTVVQFVAERVAEVLPTEGTALIRALDLLRYEPDHMPEYCNRDSLVCFLRVRLDIVNTSQSTPFLEGSWAPLALQVPVRGRGETF